ncbi:MAG: MBL fold metallo-hydrolase [Gemmatimonadetes bacterium]|nr:MBL fold metallo-hydrolase [Gemmatimonadota bacterium]
MFFRQITDPSLSQYAYLIGCQQTGEAVVVDPERDVDRYLDIAASEGLEIVAATETHIHADFLSGCRELAARGARVYLSAAGPPDWQYAWGSGYDCVALHDGDGFDIGNIHFTALHTPGHTPEHLSFLVTDRGGGATEPMGLLSGDFVFVGALGRPDLLESAAEVAGAMEPSARDLYASVRRFLDLPEFLQIWPGHGAGSACGKALGAVPDTTVGYELRFSPAIEAARGGEDAFVDYILEGQSEPPMYFARMKRDNQNGPRLRGERRPPARRTGAVIVDALAAGEVVIDTRPDRSSFMASHLPGSLYAPLTKSFSTAVGSVLVEDETPITLVIEATDLDRAQRELLRVGFDRVEGFIEPAELERFLAESGPGASIPEIDFHDATDALRAGPARVLDVRYATEYAAGHVPEAINASYTRLPDHLDRLPRDVPLLVHCLSGARAAVAASYLRREGFDVRYINDAFASYAAAGTVERGDPAVV